MDKKNFYSVSIYQASDPYSMYDDLIGVKEYHKLIFYIILSHYRVSSNSPCFPSHLSQTGKFPQMIKEYDFSRFLTSHYSYSFKTFYFMLSLKCMQLMKCFNNFLKKASKIKTYYIDLYPIYKQVWCHHLMSVTEPRIKENEIV